MTFEERLGNLLVGDAELDCLAQVVRSGRLFRYHRAFDGSASFAERLERAVAERLDVPHVVAQSSATACLQSALIAVGVTPGDLVAVPAYSFLGTATCVLGVGAIPLFVDVDDTYGLCPQALKEALGPRVKAVLAASLQGGPCRMHELRAVCDQASVPLIEDAAQGFGARLDGHHVGTLGHVGVYSLQANKIITGGEGGLAVTRDPALYERIRGIHDWGCRRPDGEVPVWSEETSYGFNFKIPELVAAVAYAQLQRFPALCDSLREVRTGLLAELEHGDIVLRAVPAGGDAVPVSVAFEPAMAAQRSRVTALLSRLAAAGVPARRLYAEPLYRHPIFARRASPYKNGFPFNLCDDDFSAARCPRAESICDASVWLMLNPKLTKEDGARFGRIVRRELAALREVG